MTKIAEVPKIKPPMWLARDGKIAGDGLKFRKRICMGHIFLSVENRDENQVCVRKGDLCKELREDLVPFVQDILKTEGVWGVEIRASTINLIFDRMPDEDDEDWEGYPDQRTHDLILSLKLIELIRKTWQCEPGNMMEVLLASVAAAGQGDEDEWPSIIGV